VAQQAFSEGAMSIEPLRSQNVGIEPQLRLERIRAPFLSAIAVGIVGLFALWLLDLGIVSRHMAIHIAMMNVVAPLLAVGLGGAGWIGHKRASSAAIWSTTVLQMGLLWAWHSPLVQQAMHASSVLALVLHTGLLLVALAFWSALISAYNRPWQGIIALLMSGKFACLLGALLVFSPHLIIHSPTAEDGKLPEMSALIGDQHLAGLLMLAACPISYILAAIYLTAQEINNLPRLISRGQVYRPYVGK
jgi:putative membrane protein